MYFTYLERKYAKLVLAILDYFFPKVEELYRKIFSDREIVNTLKLYNDFDWFAFDVIIYIGNINILGKNIEYP